MDPTYHGLPSPLPSTQRRSAPHWKRIVLISVIGIAILALISFVIGRTTGSVVYETQRLMYRTTDLVTFTETHQSQLSDDALQKINAEISLVITSDKVALQKIIPTLQPTTELTALRQSETSTTASDAALTTATTNGTYTSVYRELLRTKLTKTLELTIAVKKQLGNKTALNSLSEHLTTYLNHL